jgi:hypothetical protein
VPLASPGVPTNQVINHPAVQPSTSVMCRPTYKNNFLLLCVGL